MRKLSRLVSRQKFDPILFELLMSTTQSKIVAIYKFCSTPALINVLTKHIHAGEIHAMYPGMFTDKKPNVRRKKNCRIEISFICHCWESKALHVYACD